MLIHANNDKYVLYFVFLECVSLLFVQTVLQCAEESDVVFSAGLLWVDTLISARC